MGRNYCGFESTSKIISATMKNNDRSAKIVISTKH